MKKEELKRFNEVNQHIHKVEDHWSYKTMIKFGFTPINKEGIGFVRSFTYIKDDHKITCTTGYSSDHWKNEITGNSGYHGSLFSHVQNLTSQNQ